MVYSNGNERLLSLAQVEQATSLKKSTIYSLIQRGEFPKGRSITARRRAWMDSEVQTWIATRVGETV